MVFRCNLTGGDITELDMAEVGLPFKLDLDFTNQLVYCMYTNMTDTDTRSSKSTCLAAMSYSGGGEVAPVAVPDTTSFAVFEARLPALFAVDLSSVTNCYIVET